MNRMLFALSMACVLFTACNETQVALPQKMINAKADSVFNVRAAEITQQAKEDLDHRAAIEVKVKADSIIRAATAKDTAKNKTANKSR